MRTKARRSYAVCSGLRKLHFRISEANVEYKISRFIGCANETDATLNLASNKAGKSKGNKPIR